MSRIYRQPASVKEHPNKVGIRPMWKGNHLILQNIMLKMPLIDLSFETEIDARRLVEFGNGSKTPTEAQFERIFTTVVKYVWRRMK